MTFTGRYNERLCVKTLESWIKSWKYTLVCEPISFNCCLVFGWCSRAPPLSARQWAQTAFEAGMLRELAKGLKPCSPSHLRAPGPTFRSRGFWKVTKFRGNSLYHHEATFKLVAAGFERTWWTSCHVSASDSMPTFAKNKLYLPLASQLCFN